MSRRAWIRILLESKTLSGELLRLELAVRHFKRAIRARLLKNPRRDLALFGAWILGFYIIHLIFK
jgi:hypothetical protein